MRLKFVYTYRLAYNSFLIIIGNSDLRFVVVFNFTWVFDYLYIQNM